MIHWYSEARHQLTRGTFVKDGMTAHNEAISASKVTVLILASSFLSDRGLCVLWVKRNELIVSTVKDLIITEGRGGGGGVKVTSVSDMEQHDIRHGIDHCLCGIHSTTLAETSSFKGANRLWLGNWTWYKRAAGSISPVRHWARYLTWDASMNNLTNK